jgi:hypothetical protein
MTASYTSFRKHGSVATNEKMKFDMRTSIVLRSTGSGCVDHSMSPKSFKNELQHVMQPSRVWCNGPGLE